MRGILGFCLVIALAMLAAMPRVLAQSGVLSGPPQVNAGPSASGPSVQQGQQLAWIAVAGGFDGSGKNVGVAYSGGAHGSKIAAEDAAISACNRYGRGVLCREAFAVSTGCLFIAPGGRSGGVTWGRGATRALALEECRRGGYTCNTGRVVGGCIPGYGK